MTDREITSLLQERIKETRAELKRLENGLMALTGEAAAEEAKPKSSTGARRGRPPKASTGARRGRPPKSAPKTKATAASSDTKATPSGKRQNQYLQAVGNNPGMTTAQVAAKIGVTKPHGYALAKVMRERKLIEVKDGKNYPVSSAASKKTATAASKAPAKAAKAKARKAPKKKPASSKAKATAKQ